MKDIFAYRLKNARLIRGITIKMLTKRLGVSKQMISKYESGKSVPDSPNLIALANILRVNVDYFFRPSTVSLNEINFRKKNKTSKKKIDSIKANIRNHIENYLTIEDILSINSEFINPLLEKQIASIKDTENAANHLRKIWNIGNAPIHNIILLLETKEIKVIEIDEQEEHSFDGFSSFVNRKYPAIVINKNYTVERKRFTLFHELGHLLLNIPSRFSKKEVEKICDRFAGAMLLPNDIFLKEIGSKRSKISLKELINFQKQFGISIPAIMYRLVALEIVSENLKVYLLHPV